MRVNIGCGQTPTPGWRNFDNSPSLRLARLPVLPELLLRLRILKNEQYSFIRFARSNSLEFANAAARIPLPDESVEALYSSHMFEHLSPAGVSRFLNEALRVLKKGGIIRLAVPDLRVLVNRAGQSAVLGRRRAVRHRYERLGKNPRACQLRVRRRRRKREDSRRRIHLGHRAVWRARRLRLSRLRRRRLFRCARSVLRRGERRHSRQQL